MMKNKAPLIFVLISFGASLSFLALALFLKATNITYNVFGIVFGVLSFVAALISFALSIVGIIFGKKVKRIFSIICLLLSIHLSISVFALSTMAIVFRADNINNINETQKNYYLPKEFLNSYNDPTNFYVTSSLEDNGFYDTEKHVRKQLFEYDYVSITHLHDDWSNYIEYRYEVTGSYLRIFDNNEILIYVKHPRYFFNIDINEYMFYAQMIGSYDILHNLVMTHINV